ncbi:MAG: PEP-CTERM sorting domain-containing protein [Phycisphaerae bacterium]|nr:PEP-CTERM sorting domain-containing protein [Phycisphaerae bacterium]
MKKILFTLMLLLPLISVTHAGFDTPGTRPQFIPTVFDDGEAYYYGVHEQSFAGLTSTVRLEFAIYQGAHADIVMEDTGYEGEATEFVYAYQVFCEDPTFNYFALTGVDAGPIDSTTTDIGQSQFLGTTDSGGGEPKVGSGYFEGTRAVWEFDNGALIQGDNAQSWFLLLYSNNGPELGKMEIAPPIADDIPIPGVPEPATLVLLSYGVLLSLKRRK